MEMTPEQIRLRNVVICNIVEQLLTHEFTFEFAVVEHPKGIKIIQEVTQEQMDAMMAKNKVKERQTPNKLRFGKTTGSAKPRRAATRM